MSKRILLINPHFDYMEIDSNKGTTAVVYSTIDILKELMPDTEITTTMQLVDEETASKVGCTMLVRNKRFRFRYFSLYNNSLKSSLEIVRAIIWRVMKKSMKLDVKWLINTKKLRAYADSDVVIHISMDSYCDYQGTRAIIENSKGMLLALIFEKPLVLWAGSIGPFNSKITRPMARFIINRAKLITLRESISKRLLEEAGVNNPNVHLTADAAFLLKPASSERVAKLFDQIGIDKDKMPIVGFTIPDPYNWGSAKKSRYGKLVEYPYYALKYVLPESLYQRIVALYTRSPLNSRGRDEYEAYLRYVTSLVNHFTERLGAIVLLSSHVEQATPMTNYTDIMEMIRRSSRHQDRVRIIPTSCTASEFKGITGHCSLQIGAKMHSNIAALSQGVPTVGLAYSYKFMGIMEMLGQQEYVCELPSFEEITTKVNKAWNRRQEIRNEILLRLENVRQLTLMNGKLVKEILLNATPK